MKSKLCLSPLFVITLCILGRSDDNIVSARKRFATYKESTLPVIEHFAQLQMLTKVQGVGSIEEVFGQLKGRFTKFIDPAWRQTMKH
jgi:adenylate kinase family enzyme